MQSWKLVVVSLVSLLLGLLVGVLSTRAVYEDVEPVTPAQPIKTLCPPCPDCPVCPPPPDCGGAGVILNPGDAPALPPDSADRFDEPEFNPPPEPSFAPEAEARPEGLPAPVMSEAQRQVDRAADQCVLSDQGESGLILISMVVQVQNGQGSFRDVEVNNRQGEVAAAEACLTNLVLGLHFETEPVTGELPMKLTFTVQERITESMIYNPPAEPPPEPPQHPENAENPENNPGIEEINP